MASPFLNPGFKNKIEFSFYDDLNYHLSKIRNLIKSIGLFNNKAKIGRNFIIPITLRLRRS